jgi:hypothetical protein
MMVLRFDDESGKPLAFVINYANHNNAAGGRRISADISGYMGNLLRKLYGENLGVIFLLGACGNTNWVDWRNPERWQPHHFMDIATGLTGTVLEISAVLEHPPVEQISITNQVIRVPERPYRDFDTQVDDTFGGEADVFFKVYQEACQREEGRPLPEHELQLSVLKFGSQVAITTNPCELFCEFGLAIKSGSPVKYTLVSELTNGAMGYVPTRQAFEEGGYEIRKLPGNSFLAMDAGERIVAATLEMLEVGGP